MLGKIGVKQMKLAASWLAGAAKLAGVPIVPEAIEFAVKSLDSAEALLGGDALARAMARVRREVDAGTRAALAGEFGADWESRSDLAATLEALPAALDQYALGYNAMFAENLDPSRIAERMADAAEVARDDLFRKNTQGATLLRAVAAQAYAAAYRNRDFAQGLAVRVQQEVLDRQDRHETKLDAILLAVQAREGVPLPTLQRILAGFGEEEVTPDSSSVEARLAAKAEEYRLLRGRLDRLGADDGGVAALRREAGTLIDAGDFGGADALLARAEAIDIAAATDLEATSHQRRLSAAASRSARGDAARLRLDYRVAVEHYTAAATLAASEGRHAEWRYRLRVARTLQDRGREFGDVTALHEAIDAYTVALALAPRSTAPRDWAHTQNSLGNALCTLGSRETSSARLHLSVAAFRAAMQELTREAAPNEWSAAQNNLGNALAALGEREAGGARLEEAVAAFRAALEVRTRSASPFAWATTQNNLGAVLQYLGERNGNTTQLNEAVARYHEALEVRTRETAPLEWATTQHNLGNALVALAERDGGEAHLEEAAEAYRLALQEWTPERAPFAWAAACNSLGTALRALGEWEGGTERLEEAVEVYRLALREWTRERVPVQWAVVQHNLGHTLTMLGDRIADKEMGLTRLWEAMTACRLALEERRRDVTPLDWAMTQNALGTVLTMLGERQGGTGRLLQALNSYDGALSVFMDSSATYCQEMCMANRARAAALLAKRRAMW
jgi:tetratricopeptide (TPR) repeat protein